MKGKRTLALLVGSALLSGCAPEVQLYEMDSFIEYVLFSPDGGEVRIAGIAGWDHAAAPECGGVGFDLSYTVDGGVEIENRFYTAHYARSRGAPTEVVVDRPSTPAGFDVSIADLRAVNLAMDVRHPNAEFYARIENTRSNVAFDGDLLITLMGTDGTILDDALLY